MTLQTLLIPRMSRNRRNVASTSLHKHEQAKSFVPVESKTRTYHGRVGSECSAKRPGGSSRTGCQQNYSLRKKKATLLPKASRKRRFNVSPEVRANKILCTCRIQNADLPRSGRVEALGGAAGRDRARIGADRTISSGKQSLPFLLRLRRTVAATSL